MYPSPNARHRHADIAVHAVGLSIVVLAGGMLVRKGWMDQSGAVAVGLSIYMLCALASNAASWAYHFLPQHQWRVTLRRIDHAAIFLSIAGTFTPLLILAGTPLTYGVLVVCWVLSALGMWRKLTAGEVKSKWSTLTYLGLGAVGLIGLPDVAAIAPRAVWYILAGNMFYALGTVFYAQKSLPYRYAIWHAFVTVGGLVMLMGVWIAVF